MTTLQVDSRTTGQDAKTAAPCNTDAQSRCSFQPIDRTQSPPSINLPDEIWLTVLESRCTFPPAIFSEVMLNMVKNPNVTSSQLFRADILYDSDADRVPAPKSYGTGDSHAASFEGSLVRHLKAEYRPISAGIPGFELQRTLVRQFVPRNPRLDPSLVQTCHFFHRTTGLAGAAEENIVMYIPHEVDEARMPFYHPSVQRLIFQHTWRGGDADQTRAVEDGEDSLSISYLPFPTTSTAPLPTKLSRTALRLLQTAHKHGQGLLAGYRKRVHLDRLIPQRRYQDTYARLKAVYGRQLATQWVEVTDPGKHVFEDIGIAAFLIELWRGMYAAPLERPCTDSEEPELEAETPLPVETEPQIDADGTPVAVEQHQPDAEQSHSTPSLPPFPGFVDIGCGNGVLTHILLAEGYPGWGFDARERKTWRTLDARTQAHLHRRILVPELFQAAVGSDSCDTAQPDCNDNRDTTWHDGVFNRAHGCGHNDNGDGPFIISNHADELTAWTPLLALRNRAAFIALPCCSHDLSGARFRAPPTTKSSRARAARHQDKTADADSPPRLPQQRLVSSNPPPSSGSALPDKRAQQAAETGSLARRGPPTSHLGPATAPSDAMPTRDGTSSHPIKHNSTSSNGKMGSAYSTLCSYVAGLAADAGFDDVRTEVLRIPSTRNTCIVGRMRGASSFATDSAASAPAPAINPASISPSVRRTDAERSDSDLPISAEGHDAMASGAMDEEQRRLLVRAIVERETGRSAQAVARDWIARAEKLGSKPGSGH